MEIEALRRSGEDLEKLFTLRSYPIALRFFERAADVPEEAVFPMKKFGKHMAMCQTFSYTRMKGMTIAMRLEDHWCWTPPVSYGSVECSPGSPAFEEICKYIGVPGKEQSARFLAQFPMLPYGKYEAVVTAPLKTAGFEPDVVIIYAEAAKINHMCRSVKRINGGAFTSEFDGIDSCVYCVVPSITKNEFRITFPDPGDRERAGARDDEVILSVPGPRFGEFMDAIRQDNRFMGFGDRLLEMNLDFGHPPFYNTLFAMWGLDEGTVWDYEK